MRYFTILAAMSLLVSCCKEEQPEPLPHGYYAMWDIPTNSDSFTFLSFWEVPTSFIEEEEPYLFEYYGDSEIHIDHLEFVQWLPEVCEGCFEYELDGEYVFTLTEYPQMFSIEGHAGNVSNYVRGDDVQILWPDGLFGHYAVYYGPYDNGVRGVIFYDLEQ
jgi:hypothetical protein